MPVFAVISPSDPPKLKNALEKHFKDNYVELPRGAGWLAFASNTTAVEVANKLGVSEAETGTAIVFTIAGYWGRAPTSLWEWLSVKIAQT